MQVQDCPLKNGVVVIFQILLHFVDQNCFKKSLKNIRMKSVFIDFDDH